MRALSELKTEEVAPDIFQLGSGLVSWYVLHEGGRFTVVDSGLPGHWNQLIQFLEDRGASLEDIEAQILTHHHTDHRGNTERIRVEAGADAWIHEEDAPKAGRKEPPPRVPLWRPRVFRYFAHLIRFGIIRTRPVLEVAVFDDGEQLDLPGRPTVIHMPGHTKGNCSLLLQSKKTVIAGDALLGMNLVTGEIGPQIASSFFNEDSNQALESLTRIEHLEADLLLTTHGPNWKGPIRDAVQVARNVGIP